MRLGWHAIGQRQFHCGQHRLLVMVEYQSQDLHHVAVATWMVQEMPLQASERIGQFQEWRAIAQGA